MLSLAAVWPLVPVAKLGYSAAIESRWPGLRDAFIVLTVLALGGVERARTSARRGTCRSADSSAAPAWPGARRRRWGRGESAGRRRSRSARGGCRPRRRPRLPAGFADTAPRARRAGP